MSETPTQPSQRAVQPEEKPTVRMEPPPSWAIELGQRMADGFARQERRADAQDDRLDKMERQLTIAVEDGKDNNKRMTTLEVRMEQYESRAEKNSIRVRGESDVNLKQEAVISQVLTKLEALEKKPDTAAVVLDEVRSLAKTPTAKKIATAATPVILAALVLASAALQDQVSKLRAKPDPAPTVLVQVPAPLAILPDGGAK